MEISNEEILSRKNTSAIQQTLEQLRAKVYEQEIRIDSLQNTINSFAEKLSVMEKMLIMQKVLLTGTGPTVK